MNTTFAPPVTERAARTATLGAGCARRSGGARLGESETHRATRLELEGALVLCGKESPDAAQHASGCARSAWESDAMTVSSGQSHLAGKDNTPRRENIPRAGRCVSWSALHRGSQHVRGARCPRILRWVQPCK